MSDHGAGSEIALLKRQLAEKNIIIKELQDTIKLLKTVDSAKDEARATEIARGGRRHD
jgi:hypothetical protein